MQLNFGTVDLGGIARGIERRQDREREDELLKKKQEREDEIFKKKQEVQNRKDLLDINLKLAEKGQPTIKDLSEVDSALTNLSTRNAESEANKQATAAFKGFIDVVSKTNKMQPKQQDFIMQSYFDKVMPNVPEVVKQRMYQQTKSEVPAWADKPADYFSVKFQNPNADEAEIHAKYMKMQETKRKQGATTVTVGDSEQTLKDQKTSAFKAREFVKAASKHRRNAEEIDKILGGIEKAGIYSGTGAKARLNMNKLAQFVFGGMLPESLKDKGDWSDITSGKLIELRFGAGDLTKGAISDREQADLQEVKGSLASSKRRIKYSLLVAKRAAMEEAYIEELSGSMQLAKSQEHLNELTDFQADLARLPQKMKVRDTIVKGKEVVRTLYQDLDDAKNSDVYVDEQGQILMGRDRKERGQLRHYSELEPAQQVRYLRSLVQILQKRR